MYAFSFCFKVCHLTDCLCFLPPQDLIPGPPGPAGGRGAPVSKLLSSSFLHCQNGYFRRVCEEERVVETTCLQLKRNDDISLLCT